MTRPTRIAVIGSALSGNKGASAMLESAIQTLDEPLGEVEFTLLSMYPEEDREQNPYPNLTVVKADPAELGVVINSLALLHRLLPPLRPLLLHAMVSSLAMAVPTVVIGWSHKYREVLEMFGQEEWAFGHDQLTPEHLWGRFEELAARRDEVKTQLDEHLPEVNRVSLLQADLIADLVRHSMRRAELVGRR